jgi:hypothetical protein
MSDQVWNDACREAAREAAPEPDRTTEAVVNLIMMYEARIAAAHEKERAMTKATVDFDQLLALQQERDALAAKVAQARIDAAKARHALEGFFFADALTCLRVLERTLDAN